MAKRFQFRLETLLKVRRLHEREAKRNLAAKRAEIALVDRLNRQTAEEISRQQELLVTGPQQGRLNPITLQRGRAWIAYLRRTIAMRQAQRAELLGQLDQLQATLRQARTQTRIVEKLRERRWDEYVRDRDHKEQATADELAQQLQRYDQA